MAAYRKLLAEGVAPQQARAVLPQAMMTEWIETASLSAYARLYHLRSSKDAQADIRWYAQEMSLHLQKAFPVSWPLLVEHSNNNKTKE
jgi:thymidylate synthase (FAD)